MKPLIIMILGRPYLLTPNPDGGHFARRMLNAGVTK